MYRTIETSLWNDPKVRALPPNAKLLFIYLITNVHAHVSGLYYLPSLFIAHETGLKGIDALWDTLSIPCLALKDDKNEVVWVVNMLRYQGAGGKSVSRRLAAFTELAPYATHFVLPQLLQQDIRTNHQEVSRVRDRVSHRRSIPSEIPYRIPRPRARENRNRNRTGSRTGIPPYRSPPSIGQTSQGQKNIHAPG